jgi:hypothetical protein
VERRRPRHIPSFAVRLNRAATEDLDRRRVENPFGAERKKPKYCADLHKFTQGYGFLIGFG